VGQDLNLPAHALLLDDGDMGSLTLASQRFYHILHVTTSAGEHEKVVQVSALYCKPFLPLASQAEGRGW
jgi:hypothetical protein